MIDRCVGQVRLSIAPVPVKDGFRILKFATGLDLEAVFALADRMGAISNLFIDLLPDVEAIIVRAFNREGDT